MTLSVDVQFAGTGGAPTGGGVSSATATFPVGFGLTTALTLDIAIIEIFMANANAVGAARSVTGISNTPGITNWQRKSRVASVHGGPSNYWFSMERWYGFAANPLSDAIPLISFDGVVDESSCIAYAINGADQVTPWDVNANASKQNSNVTFGACGNTGIATTNPNCAILSCCGVPDHVNITTAQMNGNEIGVIQWFVNTFGPLDHNSSMSVANPFMTSSALSGASATLDGSPNGFIALADALQAASAAPAAVDMMGQIWV